MPENNPVDMPKEVGIGNAGKEVTGVPEAEVLLIGAVLVDTALVDVALVDLGTVELVEFN
jgi:hypothetical protein